MSDLPEAPLLAQKARLVRYASYASVSIAIVLIFGKCVGWWMTQAVSLQATLIDSLLDAAASAINVVAVRHAQRPANKKYRFGHGKVEAIAALGQSIFIAGSACWLLYEAASRLVHPQFVQETLIGIWVMVFAMILTLGLILFQNYVVARTNSAAIRADSLHYRSDFLINGGVIISLVASEWFASSWVDPVVGALIAIYILHTAWTIVAEASGILMDRELGDNVRHRVTQIAGTHPKVYGIHELRTRSSGLRKFIQLHLELDGKMTLNQAHSVADEVEELVLKEFPEAEVLIHQDPEGLVEKRG
ncbi:MAG: cation diffusion facilitator family transporter [Pseudomonadota bacterium]